MPETGNGKFGEHAWAVGELMETRSIVAIHQPNFFPWLGYFEKIARCDLFVFLDDVQYTKKGGSWSNRVRMLVAGQPKWVSAAIVRNYHGVRTIRELEFRADVPWRKKMVKTIVANYAKCAHFEEVMQILEPLITNPEPNMAEYNCRAVQRLASALEISTPMVRSSSIEYGDSVGTARLIDIVRATGGRAYLCGGGASGYQEDTLFDQAGIELIYQNFRHPEYPQRGSTGFVAGLSVMDAMFNVGLDATGRLLRGVWHGG